MYIGTGDCVCDISDEDDPDREGLIETPKRVAKMYEEVFEGMNYTNEEIAKMFSKTFETSNDEGIIEKNIPIFSYCEHHLALMYNMNVSIAYKSKGKVIGLSKIIRIVDMVSKRLQLHNCSQQYDQHDTWHQRSFYQKNLHGSYNPYRSGQRHLLSRYTYDRTFRSPLRTPTSFHNNRHHYPETPLSSQGNPS